jgi:hypothetical protein
VARIFNVFGMDEAEYVCDRVPLSPSFPDFPEKRFWRLPAQLAVVFAMPMEYVILAESDCEEVELARYTGDYKFEVAGMYCTILRTVVADQMLLDQVVEDRVVADRVLQPVVVVAQEDPTVIGKRLRRELGNNAY